MLYGLIAGWSCLWPKCKPQVQMDSGSQYQRDATSNTHTNDMHIIRCDVVVQGAWSKAVNVARGVACPPPGALSGASVLQGLTPVDPNARFTHRKIARA